MKEETLKRSMMSFSIESKAIEDIARDLDIEAFRKAVDILISCKKIITCGCGNSGISAKKFAHSLCSIEKDAFFMLPSEAVHGGLGGLKKEDALLILSKGGKTSELMPIIEVCKKKKAKLIAVTENLDSILAEKADIVIPFKVKRQSDKYNIMGTASFLASIAIFDAMLIAIMEETNFNLEQFELIHPENTDGQ